MCGMEALQEYLKAERGRASNLAAGLGITPGALVHWKRVPAERVCEVSRLTGISKKELRPDLFEVAAE
jgi:DNA-binding transcriptional regulator YdaS (Cro superfamily)